MNGMIGSSGTLRRPSFFVMAVPVVGGFRFEEVGMVGLGHITSATSQDLHRNCGKRCGKDPQSRRKRPMNPHVPAVCTIIVRTRSFARAPERHIISERFA